LHRVLTPQVSGREHLQFLAQVQGQHIPRQTWFDAFQSPRRLAVLAEWGSGLIRLSAAAASDGLAHLPELEGWAVLAIDGHYVAQASHEAKPARAPRKHASGLIYALDLRSGLIRPVAPLNRPDDTGVCHEWRVLRQALAKTKDRAGRRIVGVVDRAYVDTRVWLQLLRENGPHVVTRAKSNAGVMGLAELEFDPTDPLNAGVVRYRRVAFNNSTGAWTWIEYRDPETGEDFVFMTTLPEAFRPGVAVELYRRRWQIEKSFDVFKNKLGEQKNWACGNGARLAVGWLISSAYNLLQLVSDFLARQGITETKCEKKYRKWQERKRAEQAAAPARAEGCASPANPLPPCAPESPPRPEGARALSGPTGEPAKPPGRGACPLSTAVLPRVPPRRPQMTCQFIRTFRNLLFAPARLTKLLPTFRAMMEAYI
jgi:hypothetical protein